MITLESDDKGGGSRLYKPTSKLAQLASTFSSVKEMKKEEERKEEKKSVRSWFLDNEEQMRDEKPPKPVRNWFLNKEEERQDEKPRLVRTFKGGRNETIV